MPRKYVKKFGLEGKRNYNPVFLEKAIDAVKKNKMSIRKAAEQYAVPYTTLNRQLKGKHKKVMVVRQCSQLKRKIFYVVAL